MQDKWERLEKEKGGIKLTIEAIKESMTAEIFYSLICTDESQFPELV